MAIENFKSLNTGQIFSVEYKDNFIGSGQQGKVYEVVNVNGKINDRLLIKIYDDQSQRVRAHLIEFAKYIEAAGLRSDGLSGLCYEPLISSAGNRYAFFMLRVPGDTLDELEVYEWLKKQGLDVRLSIAYQIAYSIARLHAQNIIHADIADPNVIIDEANQTAYVIDADGGGVLGSDGRFLPNLAPLVRGHLSGSLMAPELVKDNNTWPSKESDNWSLAVMVHKILFPRLDPFFFLLKFADCLKPTVEWPPIAASDPRMQKVVEKHTQLLTLIGQDLKDLFCLTFKPWGRLYNPSARPSAKIWAQSLEIASRWVWQCSQCGNEMVAMGIIKCPVCQSEIDHAALFLGSKRIPICTDGQSLKSDELGFTDGNYIVLSFTRYGEQLQIHPQTHFQLSGKKYSPGNPVPVGPGRYNLIIFSKDSNKQVEITLKV